jgi:hypothetical protein
MADSFEPAGIGRRIVVWGATARSGSEIEAFLLSVESEAKVS